MLSFVPPKEAYEISGSRYAAVIIAAKEARRINDLPPDFREDKDTKITTLALNHLANNLINFKYPEKKSDES
jgi:DNA-directed RNA polymerase subunit K/omega